MNFSRSRRSSSFPVPPARGARYVAAAFIPRGDDLGAYRASSTARQIELTALDMTLDKALAENPILKDMAAKDPKVQEVLDIGRRLEGMSRHASVHAAGVVIAPGPITDSTSRTSLGSLARARNAARSWCGCRGRGNGFRRGARASLRRRGGGGL